MITKQQALKFYEEAAQQLFAQANITSMDFEVAFERMVTRGNRAAMQAGVADDIDSVISDDDLLRVFNRQAKAGGIRMSSRLGRVAMAKTEISDEQYADRLGDAEDTLEKLLKRGMDWDEAIMAAAKKHDVSAGELEEMVHDLNMSSRRDRIALAAVNRQLGVGGKCECGDHGCPVHKSHSRCPNRASTILYRSDMDDQTGTAMCDKCADDAMESGVFIT